VVLDGDHGAVTARERFGANLRRLREAAGLTQLELGHRCNLQNTVISRYERGLRDPQLEAIAALAEGLGVRAADLVDGIPEARGDAGGRQLRH
jgi:transcriptional regulator with XRE-family HTH domain